MYYETPVNTEVATREAALFLASHELAARDELATPPVVSRGRKGSTEVIFGTRLGMRVSVRFDHDGEYEISYSRPGFFERLYLHTLKLSAC